MNLLLSILLVYIFSKRCMYISDMLATCSDKQLIINVKHKYVCRGFNEAHNKVVFVLRLEIYREWGNKWTSFVFQFHRRWVSVQVHKV